MWQQFARSQAGALDRHPGLDAALAQRSAQIVADRLEEDGFLLRGRRSLQRLEKLIPLGHAGADHQAVLPQESLDRRPDLHASGMRPHPERERHGQEEGPAPLVWSWPASSCGSEIKYGSKPLRRRVWITFSSSLTNCSNLPAA